MDYDSISFNDIVGNDAATTAVRFSRDAVDGAIRYSLRDAVCVGCNQARDVGCKTLRRIFDKEHSSSAEEVQKLMELKDEIVEIQFKGKSEKKSPAATLKGLLLLLALLPGEISKKHRSEIAKRMLQPRAADKALVADIRANERCNRLLNEMRQPQPQEQEPVEQALVPVLVSWEEDKARRLDTLKVQRLEANFEVGKKRKLMQLELAQANQDAQIANAECDAELVRRGKKAKQDAAERDATLKHTKQALLLEQTAAKTKSEADAKAFKKMAALAADAEERRSQQKQRLIKAEARAERLAMIAKQPLIDEETARLSRQSAVALPERLQQLALVMRAANMPAERVIAESSRYIERVLAPMESGAGQQAPMMVPVGPVQQAPAGGGGGGPINSFTVRSFVTQHKLLARIPVPQREGLLSKIGVELKKQCEAQGIVVGATVHESGGSNANASFWVHTYLAPAAPLARQITDKLVQKAVGAPDIRISFFAGQSNNTNAASDA